MYISFPYLYLSFDYFIDFQTFKIFIFTFSGIAPEFFFSFLYRLSLFKYLLLTQLNQK